MHAPSSFLWLFKTHIVLVSLPLSTHVLHLVDELCILTATLLLLVYESPEGSSIAVFKRHHFHSILPSYSHFFFFTELLLPYGGGMPPFGFIVSQPSPLNRRSRLVAFCPFFCFCFSFFLVLLQFCFVFSLFLIVYSYLFIVFFHCFCLLQFYIVDSVLYCS